MTRFTVLRSRVAASEIKNPRIPQNLERLSEVRRINLQIMETESELDESPLLTPDRLSDEALLKLLVGRLAVPRLRRAGGLRQLLRSNGACLRDRYALSTDQISKLKAIQELARRYFSEHLPAGEAVQCPRDTERLLSARLRDLPYEVFGCLYLNNQHRILGFETLFRGTIDGTSVHPREVVKQALAFNAAAVIVAHNHPSGCAEPSQADAEITRRLGKALGLVDIRLLDHLIIGDNEAVSLAGRGMV